MRGARLQAARTQARQDGRTTFLDGDGCASSLCTMHFCRSSFAHRQCQNPRLRAEAEGGGTGAQETVPLAWQGDGRLYAVMRVLAADNSIVMLQETHLSSDAGGLRGTIKRMLTRVNACSLVAMR